MSWVKIIIGGGLAVAAVILLAGKKSITATVGFDPSEVTVTPNGDTADTNASSQGTP
jgi:hypothetical protein